MLDPWSGAALKREFERWGPLQWAQPPPRITRNEPVFGPVGSAPKSDWRASGKSLVQPQYGESNVGHLIGLLQDIDSVPVVAHASFDDQKDMRKTGLRIAGNKGLNCVACHTYKYKISDTMPAVDLTEMAERLQKDWFYHYMLAPQQFSPNTVMPSFWPGGKAIRKDLEGDSSFQVEAIWQCLNDGRQMGTPSGVVREPLEIVVGSEARMLRRNYPGIGKRGIGVGYPGGVNLAWDAEQMRLAIIWQGKFVDPGAPGTDRDLIVCAPWAEHSLFQTAPIWTTRSSRGLLTRAVPPSISSVDTRWTGNDVPHFVINTQT
ncbi:MAG: hypothetical protein ABGZ53_06805 [Fuerstiella sp.]